MILKLLSNKRFRAVLTLIGLTGCINSMAHAESMTQDEFNKLLLNAFKSNPELMIAGFEYAKQYQTSIRKQQEELRFVELKKALYYDEDTPVFNPNGEITVVEFFDYACGACKRSAPEVKRLLEDKRVRLVYKNVAVIAPNSRDLAKVSIAVSQLAPQSYPAYHFELMSMRQSTIEKAYELAALIGIDEDLLHQVANSDSVAQILEKNNNLFFDLKSTGTPVYYVGEEKFGGVTSYQTMVQTINRQYNELMAKNTN